MRLIKFKIKDDVVIAINPEMVERVSPLDENKTMIDFANDGITVLEPFEAVYRKLQGDGK